MKKKFKFSNMSVRSKLLSFGGVALVFTIIIAIASMKILQSTNEQRTRRYVVYADREIALSNSFTYFNQIRTNIRNLIGIYKDNAAKQKEIIDLINSEFSQIEEKVDIFKVYLEDYNTDVQSGFKELVDCINKYKESTDLIISYSNAKNYNAAEDEIETNSMVISNQANEVFEGVIASMVKEADEESERIDKNVKTLAFILIAICVVCIIIMLGLCFSITRTITVPVTKLSNAARKLAMGDIDVDCEKIHDDDLGELMDAFDHMTDTIKEQGV